MNVADDEKQIHTLEVRRFRAMVEADVQALATVFSDDLSYAHAGGLLQNKQELLYSIESGDLKCKSFDANSIKVRIYGDTAVVTGIADVDVKFRGREGKIQFRYLEVYVRRNAAWQIVAWQSARLPR